MSGHSRILLFTIISTFQQREVRTKDQQLNDAKVELATAADRKQQQAEQLLGSASGVTDTKLHQQLTLVLARYKALEYEHEDARAQLEAAQRSLAHTRDLDTRHTELEQAQAAQAERLQRERQQVTELKVRMGRRATDRTLRVVAAAKVHALHRVRLLASLCRYYASEPCGCKRQ